MRRLIVTTVALGLACAGCHRVSRFVLSEYGVVDGLSAAISSDDLQTDVAFLASDACGGRLTGSAGARRAARYITAAFTAAGLDVRQQPFGFSAGVRIRPSRNRMDVFGLNGPEESARCKLDGDFRPLSFSASGTVEGEVVFAGYGLVEPHGGRKGYDSYRDLDVTGKIVLVLGDVPLNITPERRRALNLYASDRYKAKQAADRGATGFLLVMGPNSVGGGKLVRVNPNDRTSGVSIPAASITVETADRILAAARSDLGSLQSMLDDGEVPSEARVSSAGRVRLSTGLQRLRKKCRNVVATLPPSGGVDEYVLVGAHYDHIGDGIGLGSLARSGEEGAIHNGADDNASGTSVVLELAAALAEERRAAGPSVARRGVIFACWSGEELGLIGSSEYAKNPIVPLEKTIAYFNFDMVGRLRDNKLIVQAVGSSPKWRRVLERSNILSGFNLVLQDDPYLPTDLTAFYTKGVPGLSFFTGSHEDYNRPTDDADTLNYMGMTRVAGLAGKVIDLASQPDVRLAYARVERKSKPSGSAGGRRAYTGTVPDYATSGIEGVRLADVRPGGPADLAGLLGGDIIVNFAGSKIANLQDYSDALVGAKMGEAVPIAVMRDGARIELTITPTARPD